MRTLFVLLLLLFLGLRAFAEPTAAELNNLGGTAFKSGHYSEATPLFQKAVALDPGDRFYVANLAASLRKTNRFEDAQAVLTTAMAA